ncbi:AAA family ATPase [Pantoea coffeiphila]|uniref:AAA family ATPase n=1 Tax=Pantoea coffeiphila TaxID=1465635 RepID=UPI001961CFB6|nr:AAA family ATPase [Pantoea coffeiphila]MBM7343702.1 putative ATPase [Pantoea coffeiphila]
MALVKKMGGFVKDNEVSSLGNLPAPLIYNVNIITGDNGSGKTRYLSRLANEVMSDMYINNSDYSRLICLSGTVYENFPRNPSAKEKEERDGANAYYYFGSRVNNNLFSEIAPFRMMLHSYFDFSPTSTSAILIKRLLDDIGFADDIRCKFALQDNKEGAILYAEDIKNFKSKLSDPPTKIKALLRQAFKKGELTLSDISFHKKVDGRNYSIKELSSGERSIILSTLALIFSLKNDALVLFDEPENSLHPKWQEVISSTIRTIIDELGYKATVLIATHSPLIVSSMLNKNTFIMNLPSEAKWEQSEFLGNNSDFILQEQFGLISSRSNLVIALFQRALKAYSHNQSPSFIKAMDELYSLDVKFNPEDPLYNAFNFLDAFYKEING